MLQMRMMQLIAWVLSSLLSEAILWMPQNRTADNDDSDDSDDNDDFTDTKCTAKVKNVKKFATKGSPLG